MCVFNGIRYLQAQLDSIAAQSELPQRLVVVDDGSTDGSWELLQRWQPAAPFEVLLVRNETNLGVVRNFERAIGLVEQEIIFLADQDDIWYPGKLASFVDRFAADPALGLLHSDADLIDDQGEPLQRRLFATLLVTSRERADVAAGKAYRVYAKRNLVTGAACAFRRELMVDALPFSPDWIHDEWIAFIAALGSKVEILDAPMMAYRLHGNNTVGMPLPTLRWRLRTTAEALLYPTAGRQLRRAKRLREIREQAKRLGAPAPMFQYLDMAAHHADFRAHLPRNPWRRLVRILAERKAGHYHAWSNGEISMLYDLFIAKWKKCP
jgi:glycosyltransferase involved in cell wall biosynthesis